MGLNLWPILCEYTVSFFKITIICKRKMRGLRKVLFIMILYKAVSNLCGASQIFCVILVSFYRDLVLRNNIFQCTFPNTYINLCFLHIWKEISPTEASQPLSLSFITLKILLRQLFTLLLEGTPYYSLLLTDVSIFYHPSIQSPFSLSPTAIAALPDCSFKS